MSVYKKIILMASLCVASCGFEPLYGPYSRIEAPEVENHLAQISIAPLPERTGQILRNHLLDKLNPSGEPAQPKAHLEIDVNLAKHSTSLRRDGTTQRFNMVATAHITLRDQDNKKILYKDTLKRTASFSIGDATAEFGYASTVSEGDAKKRTLLLIAEDLHLMLATYYKKWPSQKEALPIVTAEAN